jgi:hypothetical protein
VLVRNNLAKVLSVFRLIHWAASRQYEVDVYPYSRLQLICRFHVPLICGNTGKVIAQRVNFNNYSPGTWVETGIL